MHYWEIHADNRTQNEIKVGVTSSKSFDFNSAFVIIHSDGLIMVHYLLIQDLGNLDMAQMQQAQPMGKDLKIRSPRYIFKYGEWNSKFFIEWIKYGNCLPR